VEKFGEKIFANDYSELESMALSSGVMVTVAEKVQDVCERARTDHASD